MPIQFKRRLCQSGVAAALASAIAVAAGAAVAGSAEAQAYLTDARTYLQQGDARAALIQLKNAVRADPENAEARLALGQVYLQTGDPVAAEKELKAARQRGVAEERLASYLAQALLAQDRVEDMFREVPRGQRSAAVEGEILLWYGYGHGARHKLDAAMVAFTEAGRMRPDDPRPQFGLVQVHMQNRAIDAARAAAEEALRRSTTLGDRAEALAMQGEVMRVSGDAAGAERLYAESLLANPGNRAALVGRASMALAAGNPQQAEKDVSLALQVSPGHPVATYLLAVIQADAQKFDQALETLRVRALDHYAPALFLKANIHFRRNELGLAQSALDGYTSIAGKDGRSQRLLGSILLRQRNAEAAVPVLEAAAAADPNDVQIPALLAAAHMQRGDNKAAAAWLDKAVEGAPRDAETLTRLAIGQMQVGELGDAIHVLESAAELNPEALQARLLLVLAHLQEGGYDDALAAAKELERQMPDSPVPANMAGGAYMAKKDFGAARMAFLAALGKKPDFVPALVNLAQLELQQGNGDAARKLFGQAVLVDAKAVQGYAGLAEIELRHGDVAAALAWLDKAAAAVPDATAPRLRRIAILMEHGEAQKALATAREVATAFPDRPPVLEALAKAQWAAGEQANATITLRRLTDMQPRSPRAQVELGQALMRRGDVEGARGAFLRAAQIDDSYLPAHAERVGLALRDGRADEGLKIARSWHERYADKPAGALLLVDVLVHLGRDDEAMATLKKEAAKDRNPAVMLRLSEMLAAHGDGDEAVRMLQDWAAAAPNSDAPRLALANLLLKLHQYEEAVEQFETLARNNAAAPMVLNNLAWLYAQRNDPRALDYAERAFKLAPNSPEVADTLGYLLVRNRQVDRGLRLLQQAHAKLGQVPEVRYHLAVALDAAGRKDEARLILDELVAEQSQFEDASAARDLHRQLAK